MGDESEVLKTRINEKDDLLNDVPSDDEAIRVLGYEDFSHPMEGWGRVYATEFSSLPLVDWNYIVTKPCTRRVFSGSFRCACCTVILPRTKRD